MKFVLTVTAEDSDVKVTQTKTFNLELNSQTTHDRVILARQIEGLLERTSVEVQEQRQAHAEAIAEDKKRDAAKPKRAKK